MNTLIIYGSQYGTTKRYAERFSAIANLPVTSYENVKDLTGDDLIIHFGGLFSERN